MSLLTPDEALALRTRYAAGQPVARICAECGCTTYLLYLAVDGKIAAADGSAMPPLPRRGRPRQFSGSSRRRAALPAGPDADRLALVTRLWRAAERQVRRIEQRFGQGDVPATDDARALAVLVRTVRELAAFDAAQQPDRNDDDRPRDLDEFRRDLAARMEAFVAARTDPAVPGDT